MEKIVTENLFLLEFLVDKLEMDPKCDCDAPGETCVSFQFLDNAPLDICEKDYKPQRDYKSESEETKSGKSCLFSLSPEQAMEAVKQFDILVTIFKKMQPGWLPERVEIGASFINVTNLFNELMSSMESAEGPTPMAKTLKDTFDINNTQGEPIGKIGVYIRMSCFGKIIVTQFQMNLQDKSVLFKDREGKSLYRYKKAGSCPARDNTPQAYDSRCPTNPCGTPLTEMGRTGIGMSGAAGVGDSAANSSCPTAPCPTPTSYLSRPGTGGYMSTFAEPGSGGMNMSMNMGLPGMMGNGAFIGTGFNPMVGSGLPNMMTPCSECGNIPMASCWPTGFGMGGVGIGMGGTQMGNITSVLPPCGMDTINEAPCIECAGLKDAPCVKTDEPDGNFKEIGASMAGNSLTIRVHKPGKVKLEQVDSNDPETNDNGCRCTVPFKPDKQKEQEKMAQLEVKKQSSGIRHDMNYYPRCCGPRLKSSSAQRIKSCFS